MSYRSHYEDMPSEEIQRRVREMDLASDRFLRGTTAHYDPIFTPLFTSLFSGAAFGVAGLSGGALSFAVGLGTAIATTSLSVGIQRLS
jgi:hypothetical protein